MFKFLTYLKADRYVASSLTTVAALASFMPEQRMVACPALNLSQAYQTTKTSLMEHALQIFFHCFYSQLGTNSSVICRDPILQTIRDEIIAFFNWPNLSNRSPLWASGQGSWQQNGDLLCFLWGTNWIDICYAEGSRPPLWSSGQSSIVLPVRYELNRYMLCRRKYE
jgi:hypothetical protein